MLYLAVQVILNGIFVKSGLNDVVTFLNHLIIYEACE